MFIEGRFAHEVSAKIASIGRMLTYARRVNGTAMESPANETRRVFVTRLFRGSV